jgi:thioesterase domain-containing protein
MEAGERVSLLALLDPTPRVEARLTALPDDEPPSYDPDWMQHYLIRNAEEEFGIHPDDMRRLLPHERFEKYLQAAKLHNLIPADVTVAQFQRLLYVMNVNRHATKAYKARPYPGRMILLRTSPIYGFDETLGWGSLATGGLALFAFPGQHGALIEEPLVQELAEILQHCMVDPSDAEASRPLMTRQCLDSEEPLRKSNVSTGNQPLGD